eukprot:COSAG06_NODE_40996_length_396_cov_0.861953_1_plen_86_part_01
MLRERIELSHPPHQNGPGNQPPELLAVDWRRGLALYTAPRAGAGRVAGLKSFAVRCELRGWLAARGLLAQQSWLPDSRPSGAILTF